MTWIVVVLLVCSGDSCRIDSADASVVAQELDADIHKKCEAAPNCIEPRRGIYVVRQSVASPKKPVETPTPSVRTRTWI